ncbi:MAG: NYN domain-containing protein [Patescibacteria group bacterium]
MISSLLLSGDNDFVPVVRRLRERGKRIIVMSAKRHVSRELIQLAHKYVNLKKLKDRIELTK